MPGRERERETGMNCIEPSVTEQGGKVVKKEGCNTIRMILVCSCCASEPQTQTINP